MTQQWRFGLISCCGSSNTAMDRIFQIFGEEPYVSPESICLLSLRTFCWFENRFSCLSNRTLTAAGSGDPPQPRPQCLLGVQNGGSETAGHVYPKTSMEILIVSKWQRAL